MPDSDLADDSVLTSSFYNDYIREQVIVTCTSSTRPTGIEGRLIFETDTDRFLVHNGSVWRPLSGSGWVNFTPSWTNLTVGNGTNSGSYFYTAGGMLVICELLFGSTTSISGDVSITVPNSETSRSTGPSSTGVAIYRDAATRSYVGAVQCGTAATSIALVHAESGNGGFVNSTSPFTWTTNDVIRFEIVVAL